MLNAICPKCGSRYHQDQPWKKTCLPCWQKKKRAEQSSSGTDSELLRLRDEVQRLKSAMSRFTQPIAPDMLARLIRLCHPDKHGNSQASNEATAWLLAQRGRA